MRLRYVDVWLKILLFRNTDSLFEKSKYFLDHHNHLEAAALATASEAAQAAHAAASMHCSATAKLLARLSNTDLAFEWSMLCQDCTDCWSQHGKPNK